MTHLFSMIDGLRTLHRRFISRQKKKKRKENCFLYFAEYKQLILILTVNDQLKAVSWNQIGSPEMLKKKDLYKYMYIFIKLG